MGHALGITDLWTFTLGAFLIILMPGPNSLYVLSVAARRGIGAGYRGAAAVFIGDAVLMTLSAAGAASLLKTSPVLFAIVKYAGAAYLAYLGIGMLRAAWKRRRAATSTTEAAAAAVTAVPERDAERPFRRALVISLMNPKAILFFLAFFTQFVEPGYAHPVVSFVVLGLIVQAFSAMYLTALIFGGSYLAGQVRRRAWLSRALRGLAGAVFIGFGIRLAAATLA